jgi:hypothetical protein
VDAAGAGSSNELLLELFITNSGLREDVRHDRWRQVLLARTWTRERGHHDSHKWVWGVLIGLNADLGELHRSMKWVKRCRERAVGG